MATIQQRRMGPHIRLDSRYVSVFHFLWYIAFKPHQVLDFLPYTDIVSTRNKTLPRDASSQVSSVVLAVSGAIMWANLPSLRLPYVTATLQQDCPSFSQFPAIDR